MDNSCSMVWEIISPGVAGAVFASRWWFWVDAVVYSAIKPDDEALLILEDTEGISKTQRIALFVKPFPFAQSGLMEMQS